MHAWNYIADIAVPLKNQGVFFYIFLLNRWAKKCFDGRIQICVEIYISLHVFISHRYLYAANACNFRIHFPWVRSNIASAHKILKFLWEIEWLYKLFYSSKMNLQKQNCTLFRLDMHILNYMYSIQACSRCIYVLQSKM